MNTKMSAYYTWLIVNSTRLMQKQVFLASCIESYQTENSLRKRIRTLIYLQSYLKIYVHDITKQRHRTRVIHEKEAP